MRKHCFQRSVVLQDSLDSHQSACFCPRPLEEESKRRSASQKKKANLCLRIGVEDLLMSSPSWGKRTVHTRSSGDQSYRKMANLWLPIDPYFFHDLRSYYSSTASWLLSMWLLYAFCLVWRMIQYRCAAFKCRQPERRPATTGLYQE